MSIQHYSHYKTNWCEYTPIASKFLIKFHAKLTVAIIILLHRPIMEALEMAKTFLTSSWAFVYGGVFGESNLYMNVIGKFCDEVSIYD